MDAREILIANTKTQKRYKISTDAETLGELKAALDANNIDYAGMTFTEGISKIQLMDDASQLPKDVDYKGQKTNNLVFLLTNTKKNIASGYEEMPPRCEIFDIIRENHLEDDIEDHFGRRFIQVSSAELWDFVQDYLEDNEPEEPRVIASDSAEKLGEAICNYVEELVKIGCLCPAEARNIAGVLKDAGYSIIDFLEANGETLDPAAQHAVKDDATNSKIDDILNDIEL